MNPQFIDSNFDLDQKTSSLDVRLASIIFEDHYLTRYFIEKLFKEKGKLAKKIAREQAAKDVNKLVDEVCVITRYRNLVSVVLETSVYSL